jgi:hypothetical protein
MKTRTSLMLIAFVLPFLTLGASKAQAFVINWRPIGFTRGQTARLTFANIGETHGIIINWRFVDADGEIVATSERPLTIPFGRMISVDRVRTQRHHRDSGDQAAPWQAGSRAGATRERHARHLPLPQVSNPGLERLRAEAQSPLRARRHAREAGRVDAARAHLHEHESEVAQAAERNTVVSGLLRDQ